MFESFVAVPLHFTIEFFGLLVMAGGMTLVLSRPALIPGAASNRISAALGFASLAAAQILHGGSFSVAQSDSDQLLLTLGTLGVALLLVAVVSGLKPTATGAGAFVQTPGALLPGAAWLLLFIMSLVAARRGGPRAHRRLALASLFFAVSAVLTAATPKTAEFGVGDPDAYLFLGHGTKLMAFLLLGVWLWAGVRTSIRARFVASFGALLLGVVLFLSTTLTYVISDRIEGEEIERVADQVGNVVQDIQEEQTLALKKSAEQITQITEISEALRGLNGPDVPSLSEAAQLPIESDVWVLDFVALLDERGSLEAYAGRGPEVAGARQRSDRILQRVMLRLPGSAVANEVVQGREISASVFKINDSLLVLAAAEVPDAGVVVIGRFLDSNFVLGLKDDLTNIDATLLVEDRAIATTLPEDVSLKDLVPEDAREALRNDFQTALRQTIEDQTFYSAFAPLHADNGRPIDAALILSAPSNIVVDTREGVTRILFLVAMGIGAVALFLAWLSGRRITRPIQELTRTAQTVREGDLKARAEVVGEDEVGELGETFNEMTASLFRLTDDLRDAARQEHDLRARIETIIQSMADGLVAVDSDGNVLAFNREAENITGIKAKSAMGMPIERVLKAVDNQENELKLPIYDLAEGSLAGVFVPRRAGENTPVAITSAVLRDEEGEISGAVAVLRDMTREREIERMKSEFLSNISHELRTPLTPIKGYAEILARKQVPAPKMKQFIGGILDSTERLERIVGLLVDFSAMEAGRLSPRAAPVDVGEILKKLADDWTRKAKQHDLVLDVKAKLPKVFGDERLLRRSFEEVIDNAVKFSPQGGTIRLEARISPGSNGKRRAVMVTVSDEGIGIQPKDLSKIFSDFHQLDGSETRTYGGLGLGLAFVQRIVEAHAGKVDVKSEPDKGTKLTITIPARPGD